MEDVALFLVVGVGLYAFFNGQQFVINADKIRYVEATPDTVICCDHGAAALKIHPVHGGFRADDAALYPAYAVLVEGRARKGYPLSMAWPDLARMAAAGAPVAVKRRSREVTSCM